MHLAPLLAQVAAQPRPGSADAVLSPYIYVFYAAFIVAFLFTPLMRAVAIHYGIIDHPDQRRKLHGAPVAYLGGVAVFLGWIAGLALSQFLGLHRSGVAEGLTHLHVPMNIVLGAAMIAVLGLWDDIHSIRPWVKIFGQALAAGFLLSSYATLHLTAPIFGPVEVRMHNLFGWGAIPEGVIVATSCALVMLIVVGCCNATNLMDGLDGLCGGVTAVIAAGFLFLAVNMAVYESTTIEMDGLRVVLALALLGAVLGFVPYNFNPASIFMGDTGSMFLGYACAVMIVLAAEHVNTKWFLASMVIFALPVLDTLLAFVRRWVNHRPIFSADRHHFHHQMLARGFTVKQTVVISYGLAVFFAVAGTAIAYVRTRYVVAFYLVLFGSIMVAAYKMGMVHEKPPVVRRRPLEEHGSSVTSNIQSGDNVVEISDDRAAGSLASNAVQEGPGTWKPPQA